MQKDNPSQQQNMEQALELIKQGMSSAKAAKQLGYGYYRIFTITFFKHFGYFPSDVRKKQRKEQDKQPMEQALKLLKEGVSLTDITKRLGFAHVSNFSQKFFKHFGYLPSTIQQKELEKRIDKAVKLFNAGKDLNQIAQQLQISPQTIKNYFEKHFGSTYKQITKQQQKERLLKSTKELLKKKIPLKEIANQLGYNSLSAFSKAYKRSLGVSPGNRKISRARQTFTQEASQKMIAQAKLLIKNTLDPLRNIAKKVGFSTYTSFVNHLKKITGDYPKNMRNEAIFNEARHLIESGEKNFHDLFKQYGFCTMQSFKSAYLKYFKRTEKKGLVKKELPAETKTQTRPQKEEANAIKGYSAEEIIQKSLPMLIQSNQPIYHIAKKFKANPVQFCIIYKRHTGVTPKQVRDNTAFCKAQHLIIEEGKTPQEAAQKIGYKNMEVFSTIYTARFGVSPYHAAKKAQADKVFANKSNELSIEETQNQDSLFFPQAVGFKRLPIHLKDNQNSHD